MSYTRDTSEDLVWNSSTNSYEPVSEPSEGILIDGNGNVIVSNNKILQIDTNTTLTNLTAAKSTSGNIYMNNNNVIMIGGSEPEILGNYFVLDNNVKTPIYLKTFAANGSNYSYVYMSDSVIDFNTGYHCSYTSIPSTEGFYCSKNNYSSAAPWSLQSFSDTRFDVPLVDIDFNTIETFGRTIKKIILTAITGTVKSIGKRFFESARTDVEVIDISKAVTIDIRSAFNGYTNLKEIRMDSASSVTLKNASASLGGTFANTQISSLKFPLLTSQSTIIIDTMLTGLTGCIIHFPSNLESVIQSLAGYPNFGGTNTVLAFDLPATS